MKKISLIGIAALVMVLGLSQSIFGQKNKQPDLPPEKIESLIKSLNASPEMLRKSAKEGDLERVTSQLKLGVDVNSADGFGFTPLHYAAAGGHYKVVDALMRMGANSNLKTKGAGLTALHMASHYGHDRVVMLLLQLTRVNVQSNQGDTALHFAAGALYGNKVKSEHYKIVDMLLRKGANKNIKNNKGKTAGMVAREKGNYRIAKKLQVGAILRYN